MLEVGEVLADRDRLEDEGQDPHLSPTLTTDQRVDLVHAAVHGCPEPSQPPAFDRVGLDLSSDTCAAKRGALFGAFLCEEIVEPVPHCMWTFTIPKLLRPYFLHHRPLLGELCRAAWETVCDLITAATADDVRPGMVATVHTAASNLRFHPHIHALASRGGWDRDAI